MKSTVILDLVSARNYIPVNRSIAKVVGLEAAGLLGELAGEYRYWADHGKLKDGDWFYSTIENIEEQTGMSRKSQDTAIKRLVDCGLLEVKRMEIPAKRFFRINCNNLLSAIAQSGQTGLTETDTTVCPKGANSIDRKGQETNIINNTIGTNIRNIVSSHCDCSENTPALRGEATASRVRHSKAETKHKHGEYENVLLTDKELEKLKELFPDDLEKRIEKLSEGKALYGYNYKSDYAAIRNWARRDNEKSKSSTVKPSEQPMYTPDGDRIIEMSKDGKSARVNHYKGNGVIEEKWVVL